jgi:hypothetical protein
MESAISSVVSSAGTKNAGYLCGFNANAFQPGGGEVDSTEVGGAEVTVAEVESARVQFSQIEIPKIARRQVAALPGGFAAVELLDVAVAQQLVHRIFIIERFKSHNGQFSKQCRYRDRSASNGGS